MIEVVRESGAYFPPGHTGPGFNSHHCNGLHVIVECMKLVGSRAQGNRKPQELELQNANRNKKLLQPKVTRTGTFRLPPVRLAPITTVLILYFIYNEGSRLR